MCADQTTCTANSYGGTSFAAPMWAGYMALVNQQSVTNGNGLLGFINPSLYSIGAGSSYTTDFHDITSGSNGYSATTGYDLATGWGSPNGSGLINALAGSSSSSTAAAITSPTPGSTLTGRIDDLYLDGRHGWSDRILSLGGHLARHCQSGEYRNFERHQRDRDSAHQRSHDLRAALDSRSTARPCLSNSYTYTEVNVTAAAMTSPTPGSTLTGASTTFTWTAGTGGVTGYYLWVGTSPGTANLVNIGISSGTSATVTSAHQRSHDLCAALDSSSAAATCLSNSYTYTEVNVTAAAMTSPTPGSTLTGRIDDLYLDGRHRWSDRILSLGGHLARHCQSGEHRNFERHQRDRDICPPTEPRSMCSSGQQINGTAMPLQQLHLH